MFNKKIIIPFITIIFCFLIGQNINAQTKKSVTTTAPNTSSSELDDDFNPGENLEEQLIPLEDIIVIAIENSPYVKYDAAMIESRRNNVILAKRDWQKSIGGTGTYTWGNQKYSYLTNATTPGAATPLTTNLLNGYRYGFVANIPLTDITARGPKIKATQAELEAFRYKREQTILMLKRQVIEEYTNLIMGQKLLKIKNEGKENARVAYQMAEKQFKEASMQLSELTKANESSMNAEIAYQISVSEFKIMYLNFQELVGVKLSTLKRK